MDILVPLAEEMQKTHFIQRLLCLGVSSVHEEPPRLPQDSGLDPMASGLCSTMTYDATFFGRERKAFRKP